MGLKMGSLCCGRLYMAADGSLSSVIFTKRRTATYQKTLICTFTTDSKTENNSKRSLGHVFINNRIQKNKHKPEEEEEEGGGGGGGVGGGGGGGGGGGEGGGLSLIHI